MKRDPIKTINYNGYVIEIYHDDDPPHPRKDFDNICEFHCSHRNYNLGDKGFNYRTGEECIEAVEEKKKNGDIVLSLYIYDHSGITISLNPFSCPWDSGQVGFVVVPRLKIIQEFGKKIFSKYLKDKAMKIAKSEVEIFDQYLTGQVYEYKIKKINNSIEEEDYEEVDSCYGHYGEIKDIIKETKSIVDYYIKNEETVEV